MFVKVKVRIGCTERVCVDLSCAGRFPNCRLRQNVSAGVMNPLSEAEMDAHTIRSLREEAAGDGRPPRPLMYVKPDDKLSDVAATLADQKCSMTPILTSDPNGLEVGLTIRLRMN